MNTVKMTNAATGEVTELKINTTLKVGQTFRLIGRDLAFRAVAVNTHPMHGLMVWGVSLDGRYRTGARVVDTAAVL